MAKKQITVEEYKAKQELKKVKGEHFSKVFISSLAVFLSCVIVFGMVSIAYTLMAKVGGAPAVQSGNNVQNNGVSTEIEKDDPTLDWEDDAVTNEPSDETVGEQGKEESGEESKKPYSTIPEIVELFNTSVNKVKTEAVKVTKNYENRDINKLELPSVLQAVGDALIGDVMKDDTDPVVYATREEIKENFMVPNQDYASRLKASDVEKAVCKDNGKEYEVSILVKKEKSPSAGNGVGAAFDVIEAHEIAEKAPSFIKEFSTEYYNCVVKVNIDKETGRVTHANYSTPLYMNVVAEMFGTHNVVMGVTFEKDYTIEY